MNYDRKVDGPGGFTNIGGYKGSAKESRVLSNRRI